MNDVTGILAGLALVLAVATFFIATALSRKRAVEEAGYRQLDVPDERIAEIARMIFDREPLQVYARDERNGSSWLAFVGTADNGNEECAVLVQSIDRDNWPKLALIRDVGTASDRHRKKVAGFLAGLEAMDDAPGGTKWRAYREPGRDVPATLSAWIVGLIAKSGVKPLLGIAVSGPFLISWTDRRRVGALLSAGASLSASIGEAPP